MAVTTFQVNPNNGQPAIIDPALISQYSGQSLLLNSELSSIRKVYNITFDIDTRFVIFYDLLFFCQIQPKCNNTTYGIEDKSTLYT